MTKSNSKKKPRSKAGRDSRKSSVSPKPATTGKDKGKDKARSYRGRKRGPKFRASEGDESVERRIPVPSGTPNSERRHTKHRSGALRRLGISVEQLRGIPRISHILDHAEGGVATVIAALRLSGDDETWKFLDKYDALSETDKQYLSVEEICVAAGVDTKRLLELAVSSLVEDGQSAGQIIAASYHPRIIKKTAESALHDDAYIDENGRLQASSGHQDRRLFLQGTGFLPQSEKRSGGVFNVNVIQNQANVDAPLSAQPEQDQQRRFASAEDGLRALHETIDGNKLLDAPKAIESPSNVTIGHMYKDMSETVEELECIPSRR